MKTLSLELSKKLQWLLEDRDWSFINWYDKKYIITDNWLVISLKRSNPRILKPLSNWRYLQIDLYKTICGNKEKKRMLIHRLVWMYFLIKETHKNNINHKDWNKLNNNISNLEWCTQKENIIHSYKNWLTNPSYKKVMQFDLNWNLIAIRQSFKEAEKITWARRQDIRKCILWLRKQVKWFIWKDFTLEEAIEFLPPKITIEWHQNCLLNISKSYNDYMINYAEPFWDEYWEKFITYRRKTLLKATEKMIEYLLNNNLLWQKQEKK